MLKIYMSAGIGDISNIVINVILRDNDEEKTTDENEQNEKKKGKK